MLPTRVKITFKIQVAGPLHIGTGFRRGLLHRTVVRDGQSQIYIPGSSLKGKVRNSCEDLAKLHGVDICGSALPGLMCGSKPDACIVCRIFGSPSRPSSLFWSDAHLLDELKKMSKLEGRFGMAEARTQVQMSRLRGVGSEDRLYTTETARSGLTFATAIDGWLNGVPLDNGTPSVTYELLLLLAGLNLLNGLGGNRSRGGGECRVTPPVCEVNGQPVTVNVSRIEELMLYADALAEEKRDD